MSGFPAVAPRTV